MIVAIASGKGGTGKTTIAVNMALSLRKHKTVQLLDCDVEEPNAAIFLNPKFDAEEEISIPIPSVDNELCNLCGRCAEVCFFHAIAVLGNHVLTFPELCHGCGGCTLFCPTGAITEKPETIGTIATGYAQDISFIQGRLKPSSTATATLIKEVRRRAADLDAVLIDAPPGTSCPVVASVNKADFCLLVTEPTPFGLNDLMLAVDMVRTLNIPLGVIINRSDENDDIIKEYCGKNDIPILMSIPFQRQYAAYYAQGIPLVEADPEWEQAFQNLWDDIERRSR
ncbi:ATP-binding protein [Mahella sp.]|uniref:ATP-binding protein n=1 Tax=Mahella sp. TaxID=2798721 RepID=UPI0025BD6CCA|nr:ATP-binding protein [Mahella sp.]MBZ4666610.1 cobyrinic acid a,c-diamide synthase [Mahella sp.]MDK2903439.1 hypothetical protein [Clostridiales bacterium]